MSLIVDTLNVTFVPNPPSFLVSESIVNMHQNLRGIRRGRNMAFRVAGGCGGCRGRPVANSQLLEVMERLTTRLEATELRTQGNNREGDVSDPKIESLEEEEVVEINLEMRFLKNVFGSSLKSRSEVPVYEGNLDPEELINWINEMEKSFDYEEMAEERKVKFVVTRLKGHASLWWDGVQIERRRLGKHPIKNWNRLVVKLREKFLPRDY